MKTDPLLRAKEYYKTMEKSIEDFPPEQRGKFYRQCAVNCVKDSVLKEQQRQFKECGNDLDLQYTKYGNSDGFFAKIIEKGHIYEIGYPKCVCPMVDSGFANSPVHCECSRQSILYILHELLPDKKISVKIIGTVLGGAENCRFRVIIE